MANSFGVGEQGFSRSNGSSQVFLDTLNLAASTLARRSWEKACAARLNNPSFWASSGSGGLDLLELPWSRLPEEAVQQRTFLRRAADLALTRHRWKALPYSPRPDLACQSLTWFRRLLDHPQLDPPLPKASPVEEFGDLSGIKFCQRHGVYHEDSFRALCMAENVQEQK